MAVSSKYIRHQLPVIAGLGKTALSAVAQKLSSSSGSPALPGALIERTVRAPSRSLIDAYVRSVGGDPKSYRGRVPAHLFPHWSFPLAAQGLKGLPYPLMQIVNGGCRLEIRDDLPAGEPLEVTSQLVDIDDDGRRAVMHQIITTGTASCPEAVVAHLYPIVVLSRGGSGGAKRERPRVPSAAQEVAFYRLRPSDALDFAKLTGDFNPIHWVKPYAKAFGFESTIMHGFGTMAYAIEGLHQNVYSGATSIRVFDAKFVRPLALPARVGLYTSPGEGDERRVTLGDGPGGFAYMEATFAADH